MAMRTTCVFVKPNPPVRSSNWRSVNSGMRTLNCLLIVYRFALQLLELKFQLRQSLMDIFLATFAAQAFKMFDFGFKCSNHAAVHLVSPIFVMITVYSIMLYVSRGNCIESVKVL